MVETHFWNILKTKDALFHIDPTWQQFPQGSKVHEYIVLDRNQLGDSKSTIKRCDLLLERVNDYLKTKR